MNDAVVIVGASHAGVSTAAALRQSGWQEPIHLLCAEQALPYHRPPLSKAFLSGERDADQIVLRGEQFYLDQGIDLVRDCRACDIDLRARQVQTTRGAFNFSRLVLATGAQPRRLTVPGGDLKGIHMLRTLADAATLKDALSAAGSVVIVGGGFIGLEAAATATKQGLSVTVIEAQNRLLERALPVSMSDYLARFHRANGVRIRLQTSILQFIGDRGRVVTVELSDGSRLPADLVVVGAALDLSLARDFDAPLAKAIETSAHQSVLFVPKGARHHDESGTK